MADIPQPSLWMLYHPYVLGGAEREYIHSPKLAAVYRPAVPPASLVVIWLYADRHPLLDAQPLSALSRWAVWAFVATGALSRSIGLLRVAR
jgi:hypothetical protein